jgi:DNA transformation protein
MRNSPDTLVRLTGLLAPLGPVRAKAMFGGHGLYLGDAMLAIVADDTLYLKADDGIRAIFEAAGAPPFRPYPDRPAAMSFYRVPADRLDDPALLLDWARPALEAARRAVAAKRRKRR